MSFASLSSFSRGPHSLTRATLLTATTREEDNSPGTYSLRSGLYFVRAQNSEQWPEEGSVYVVYWPEPTTWDDNAASAVHRNRVTFMRYVFPVPHSIHATEASIRYLTKISDQIIALIDHEHASKMQWKDDHTDEEEDSSDDDEDRLYNFEVSKSVEQEESVNARPGFEVGYTNFIIPALAKYWFSSWSSSLRCLPTYRSIPKSLGRD
jgi:hypothetical protein